MKSCSKNLATRAPLSLSLDITGLYPVPPGLQEEPVGTEQGLPKLLFKIKFSNLLFLSPGGVSVALQTCPLMVTTRDSQLHRLRCTPGLQVCLPGLQRWSPNKASETNPLEQDVVGSIVKQPWATQQAGCVVEMLGQE